MNRFGVSTNCCMGFPLPKALELLSEFTDFVEIQCDAKHSLFFREKVCAEFDLSYSIHAPTGDGNIAEPFEPIRKASLEALRQTAEIGDRIGAKRLVIHPGFCLFPKLWDASLLALDKSIEELGRMQDDFSVKFVIENLGSWDCNHFKTPEFVEKLRENNLGFILDVGHANLMGNLSEFLLCKPDHFHLHDNFGVQDDHIACGMGTIDFSEVVKSLGDATAVVEVGDISYVGESLEFLKKFL